MNRIAHRGGIARFGPLSLTQGQTRNKKSAQQICQGDVLRDKVPEEHYSQVRC